jgi:hypothetical protein
MMVGPLDRKTLGCSFGRAPRDRHEGCPLLVDGKRMQDIVGQVIR